MRSTVGIPVVHGGEDVNSATLTCMDALQYGYLDGQVYVTRLFFHRFQRV